MPKPERPDVYISLGSNLGDRKANIFEAIKLLSEVSILQKLSPIYKTAPVGFEKQPDFLNMVCLLRTSLTPQEFLNAIKQIEKTIGRKKTFRNGPRVIDIDIIFWGNEIIKDKNLQIPHARAHQREFVLRPLARINSSFEHPILRKNVFSLLRSIEPQGVRYFAKAPSIQDIIEVKQTRSRVSR